MPKPKDQKKARAARRLRTVLEGLSTKDLEYLMTRNGREIRKAADAVVLVRVFGPLAEHFRIL